MADRREFRKEVREHIKDFRTRCDIVRAVAANYWAKSEPKLAAVNAAALKSSINSLFAQVRVLAEVGILVDDTLLVQVRINATGGDFEKKGRRRAETDSLRLLDIGHALDDLTEAVDASFYQRFKPSKPRGVGKFFPILGSLFLVGDRS